MRVPARLLAMSASKRVEWGADLAALAGFAGRLSGPDFDAGAWTAASGTLSGGWATLGPVAQAFVEAAKIKWSSQRSSATLRTNCAVRVATRRFDDVVIRPYLSWSVDEIGQHAWALKKDPAELDLALAELSHRTTQAARTLERQLKKLRADLSKESKSGHPVSPATRQIMTGVLGRLREKLIDISKRNPLIAFKHSERGATFCRVVDELPDALYERLSVGDMAFEPLPNPEEEPADQKTNTFRLALETARLTDSEYLAGLDQLGEGVKDEESVQKLEQELVARVREALGLPKISSGKKLDIAAFARANGFNPSFELAAEDGGDEHLSDSAIRVLYTRDRLDARLRTIYDRYRGHAAELGIHTLQIAFGFVEWREADGEKQAHHAPLLLMPVHLRREIKVGNYRYALSGEDENLSVNMALQEMLKRNFGVVLPGVSAEDTPETYFANVQQLLEDAKRELRLVRYVTIAVLPFPNMAVWRDLDTEQWPSSELVTHPQLQRLLGATGGAGGSSAFPTDYDVEEMASASVPPLVLPADVSQHSALIDACSGKSLAVEGPPGTGKSQTIANMIAAALNQERRVLFVAEKRAALEVVARRLEQLGFGPLMLELHSERSTKSQVITSLQHRLNSTKRGTRQLEQALKDQTQRRDLLKLYRSLLRQSPGALNRPTNALIWREMALRQAVTSVVPRAIWSATVPKAAVLDELDLLRRREALDAVVKTAHAVNDAFADFTASPWHAAQAAPAQPIGQDEAREQLVCLIDALRAVEKTSNTLCSLVAADELGSLAALREYAEAIERLPECEGLEEEVLSAALRDSGEVKRLVDLVAEWQSMSDLVCKLHPTPAQAPIELIKEAESAFAHPAISHREPGAARERSVTASATAQRLADLADFSARLRDTLSVGKPDTAATLACLASAVAAVAALDDDALSHRSEVLTEDGVAARLAEATRQAESITARENELATVVDLARIGSTPASELDALANVLVQTPFLMRPFSSGFRAALARSRTYSSVPAAKPSDLARALIDAAAFIRARDEFRQDARFARLFQSENWSGHLSNFDAASRACAVLADVSVELTRSRLDEAQTKLATSPARILRSLAEEARSAEGALQAFGALQSSKSLPDAISSLKNEAAALSAAMAAAELAGLPDDVIIGPSEQLSTVLAKYQSVGVAIDEAEADLPWFRGRDSNTEELRSHIDCAANIRAIGLPEALINALLESDAPIALIAAASELARDGGEQISEIAQRWEAFCAAYEVNQAAFLQADFDRATFGHLQAAFERAYADKTGLQLFADLGRYKHAADQLGLGWFIASAENAGCFESLADAFELALIRTLLQKLFKADGALLERLGGAQLADASDRFVELDKQIEELEATRIVAERLADEPPPGNGTGARTTWTDQCLVENECSKIKRHIPIRDLVTRAHAALQVLKPVWLMSPTSVAQFVPPGTAEFDLVIVDEASQMTPEMAVGALARAGQVVIVGDPKQLPPSNFFKNRAEGIDDDDEDDGLDVESESILDLAFSRLDNRRRLKWHYRSQHASLIQFSNRQFYDGELVIFPSPVTSDDFLGVKSTFVGGAYEGRVNVKEAEAVIEALVGLIYARPELTFGVVAMNLQQRELIFQEFERIKTQNRVVAAYVEAREGTVDELFIKNLENVQGDERDIILVSTVYGPPPGGGRVLQRFGLFNRKDGHRRLNVLVTRARMATLLYTSLRPNDVVITETSSQGVRSLREYLGYAEGAAFVDHDEGGEADSDFEEFVADRIRAFGYEVVPQVGVEGFRIDLGVKHSAYPTGYLAGVECDGATYHSALSVRDRDRIRQEVLERLGWRIYRIWSTDWFNDPERETTKLLAWLERLREKAEATFAGRQHAADASKGAESLEQPPETVPVVAETPAPKPSPVPESSPVAAAAPPVPVGPSGKHHVVDGIDFYEEMPGFFEVWIDAEARGSVERVSTAMRSANVYGSSFKVEKPQFRVTQYWDEASSVSDDIYAAVRRIAAGYRTQLGGG
jgi:very-short-patch-repair endonuclease